MIQPTMASTLRCVGCFLPPFKDTHGVVIPLKECSRCHAAAYHNAECQKRHYSVHKQYCRPASKGKDKNRTTISTAPRPLPHVFTVEQRSGRGKCLVAKKLLKYGNVISLSANKGDYFQPLVPPVLFEGNRTLACAVCFGTIKPATTTAAALKVSNFDRYPVTTCSSACHVQASSWLQAEVDTVETACRLTGGGPPKFLPTAMLVYRIVAAIESNDLQWHDIAGMDSHPAEELAAAENNESHHLRAVVMTVRALLSVRPTPFTASVTVDKIAQVLAKIKFNGFSICDVESNALGIGLFKTANRINHSCNPNAMQTFLYARPGTLPRLRVTACSKSIAIGEEICISYIDNSQPFQMRQESLARDYRFVCTCPYCLDDQHEGFVMGLRCFNPRCQTASKYFDVESRVYWSRQTMEYKCNVCQQQPIEDPKPLLESIQACLQSNSEDEMRHVHETLFLARDSKFDPSSWYVHEMADRLARLHINALGTCATESDRGMHLSSACKLLADIRDNLPPYGAVRDWQTLGVAILIYKQHKLLLLQGLAPDFDDLCFAEMQMEEFFTAHHPVLQEQVWQVIRE